MARRFNIRRSRGDANVPLLVLSQADPEMFVAFYDELFEQALRYFVRRTFDSEASFDLTAETFARAYANRLSFRGSTNEEMYAWFWTIARRLLASWYERGRGDREMISRLGLEPQPLSDPEIERIEELVDLETARAGLSIAIGELSPEQQQAIRLRVLENQAYPVIAERLDVTEDVVRARVSRGLGALRRSMQANDAPVTRT